MTLYEQYMRHVPDYYPTMYQDGFTQAEILYAFRRQMRREIAEREARPDPPTNVKFNVEVRKK